EPERLYDGRYYGNYRGIVPQREINAEIRELGFHSGVAAAESHGKGRTIERGNILRSARVAVVTPNFHSLLGVRPILGRILSDIDVASEPHTVVLSERMWRQLFPRHQALDDAVVRING